MAADQRQRYPRHERVPDESASPEALGLETVVDRAYLLVEELGELTMCSAMAR